MKITSVNVNGIRAAARKGFFEWIEREQPDVVCIQETKAQEWQLTDEIFKPAGYHCTYHDAEKKGYSGVAIYSRVEPDQVIEGLEWPEFDSEGRYIEYRFGSLSVVSLYMPSGSSKEERQQVKFDVMDRFMPMLKKYRKRKREYVICGDWNIAHTNKDIKNWKGNQKNSGFLPEERAWLTELFGPAGWVDGFRVVNQEDEQYTWWSNRGQAWAKNVGWRIDYHVVTPGIADRIVAADIYTDERFSDHAPLTLEYDADIEDFR
ncbi:MAG: exodeoxyribonuclease III [Gammaproteobacteria bacterium]|nr:exodeoxyribonuclease III [Gammaproteobacteria bacterium]